MEGCFVAPYGENNVPIYRVFFTNCTVQDYLRYIIKRLTVDHTIRAPMMNVVVPDRLLATVMLMLLFTVFIAVGHLTGTGKSIRVRITWSR